MRIMNILEGGGKKTHNGEKIWGRKKGVPKTQNRGKKQPSHQRIPPKKKKNNTFN